MNYHIFNDILSFTLSSEINTYSAIFKLVLSMICGALVGYERKRKGQIAGIRTFALIAMGSTLAMIVSIYIPQEYMGLKNGDPGRVAAQVITGIGFLGAGAIIHSKGSVRGLTTAAGIWMISAIGLAIGVGLYIVSLIATALIFIILVTLEQYEHKMNLGWDSKILRIVIPGIINSTAEYKAILIDNGIHVSDMIINCNYDNNCSTIEVRILHKHVTDFIAIFDKIKAVRDTNSIALTMELDN